MKTWMSELFLSISLLEILIIGIILKNYEEGFVKFMILTKILNS